MSLREMNHSRTREALVGSALALFVERGFQGVTVDDVCQQAQVARRTYFRYFPTKEAVVVAPLEDLWDRFLDHAAGADERGTLIERLTEMLVDTLDALPPTWSGRAVMSLALIADWPEIDSAAQTLCRRTTIRALAELGADPHDPAATLAADLFSAGVINAQHRWVGGQRKPTTASLRGLVAEVPALLTEAVVLHV